MQRMDQEESMKRADALKQFAKEHAAALQAYEKAFWNHLFAQRDMLLKAVRTGFAELAVRAAEQKKQCQYIYCFFLRQDMCGRAYKVYAQAVDENYVVDRSPAEVVIDLAFLFEDVEALWADLLEKRRKYVWKVNEYDVNAMFFETIAQCHWKIAFLLRFLFRETRNQIEIRKVINSPRRIVRWGEYRDRGEIIFMCHDNAPRGKLRGDLLLSYRIPHVLRAAYYDGETEHKSDCRSRNFRYTVFRNCTFQETVFDNCDFTGCFFCRCSFAGCRFQKTTMHLVRFTNCRHVDTDWEAADFYGVLCENTELTGLTQVQKESVVCGEEEFHEAVFFYESGQKASGRPLPAGL